jgi:hypothetical protein
MVLYKVVASLSLLFLSAHALADEPLEIPLKVDRVITVPNVFSRVIIGVPKCAPDGSVLLRPFDKSGATSVVSVSSNGQAIRRFSLPLRSEFSNSELLDFALSPQGEMFFLLVNREQAFVVAFRDDGTLRAKMPVEIGDLFPSQFAVTRDGEFIVPGHAGRQASVLVLDRDGRLSRKLPAWKHDLKPPKADSNDAPAEFLRSVELGTLAIADNGNIFISRNTLKGPVFILASDGAMLKTIDLLPPSAKAQLLDVRPVRNQILVLYSERDEHENDRPHIQVLDTSTGQSIRRYRAADDRIGVGAACYSGDEFTFTNVDENGRLQLLKVSDR